MNLIYTSYPYIGSYHQIPAWIQLLMAAKRNVYLPSVPLLKQKELLDILHEQTPKELFKTLWLPLGMDQTLEEPLDEAKVERMLESTINQLSHNLCWKHQYMLIRSDLVMVDLDLPSYGEVAVDVMIASALQIPIIGVCAKIFQAPPIAERLECLIHPSKVQTFLQTLPPPPETPSEEPPPPEKSSDGSTV